MPVTVFVVFIIKSKQSTYSEFLTNYVHINADTNSKSRDKIIKKLLSFSHQLSQIFKCKYFSLQPLQTIFSYLHASLTKLRRHPLCPLTAKIRQSADLMRVSSAKCQRHKCDIRRATALPARCCLLSTWNNADCNISDSIVRIFILHLVCWMDAHLVP